MISCYRIFPKPKNKSYDNSQFENWEKTVKEFLVKNGFKNDLRDIRKYYNMYPTLYTKQEWSTEDNHPINKLKELKLNAANITNSVIGPNASTLKLVLDNEEVSGNSDKLLEHYKETLIYELKKNQYSWPFVNPVQDRYAQVSVIYFVKEFII